MAKPGLATQRTDTGHGERSAVDPQFWGVIEPAIVFATLLGTAFGVKLLIWGKGPIRKVRPPEDRQALEQRLAELEEHMADLSARQDYRLAELEERLDFTERVLTQHREEAPRGIEPPDPQTPDRR